MLIFEGGDGSLTGASRCCLFSKMGFGGLGLFPCCDGPGILCIG